MNLKKLALNGAKIILTTCLSLKEEDVLALFWDEETAETAEVFKLAATELGINVRERKTTLLEQSRFSVKQGLSLEDSEALSGSRGVITCLSNHSEGTPYRSSLVEDGTSQGIRFGHMPGANLELLANAPVNIDYEETSKRCDDLALALTLGEEVKLQTYVFSSDTSRRSSYDLNFNLGGINRPAITSTGIIPPGTWGNIPGGETFIAPKENTADGIFVLNGSFKNHIFEDSSYLLLHFARGNLIKIEGDAGAKEKLEKIFDSKRPDDEFYNSLAELGIGVNEGVTRLTGNALFDEKCAGTAHIAVGDSKRYGGVHQSSIHEDLVSRLPSLWIDGKPILDCGKNAFNSKDWRETLKNDFSELAAFRNGDLISRTNLHAEKTKTGAIQIHRPVISGRICIYTIGEPETSRLLAQIYALVPSLPNEIEMTELQKAAGRIIKKAAEVKAAVSILIRHKLISLRNPKEV